MHSSALAAAQPTMNVLEFAATLRSLGSLVYFRRFSGGFWKLDFPQLKKKQKKTFA
jgi:hypothetical protein